MAMDHTQNGHFGYDDGEYYMDRQMITYFSTISRRDDIVFLNDGSYFGIQSGPGPGDLLQYSEWRYTREGRHSNGKWSING